MSLNLWRPWIDPHLCGEGSQPERYVLRTAMSTGRDASFLGIASQDQLIETVADPRRAWLFHTHERAVVAAREIAGVLGLPVDVVKLQ